MFVLQFLPYIMSVGEKIVSLYESNRKPVTIYHIKIVAQKLWF